jgi:hypothetical protein
MKAVAALAVCALAGGGWSARAQTGGETPARVIGEVQSLDSASRRMSVKTAQGETVAFSVRENAPIVRAGADVKDLKTAPRIALSEIAVGDRVAATTHAAAGGLEAGAVVVMTQSDLADRRRREEEEWRKRGAGGIVTAVDPALRTFTLKSGAASLVVHPAEKAEYRRYSEDSVRFADARPGSFNDIQPGDQARVLGDRSPDGASLSAERIVSGTFRQIAGTVVSIDAQAKEIRITDLATHKPVTVRIDSDSTVRTLPPAAAAMLARRMHPAEGAPAAGGRSGAGPDPNAMLDRLPPAALDSLKPGDAVMVSGSKGADPARIKAIVILAGVEPLLTASPSAARDLMSGWMNGGGGPDLGMSQ